MYLCQINYYYLNIYSETIHSDKNKDNSSKIVQVILLVKLSMWISMWR